MRLLIISRLPWNDSNSFGNTFTNLFGGIEGLTIYNLCCSKGEPDNHVVEDTWQMTTRSIIDARRGNPSGQRTESRPRTKEPPTASATAPHRRLKLSSYTSSMIHDLIWKAGKWKTAELRRWLDEIRPDALYLPVYRSGYMLDVARYVADYTGVPYAVHITDDVYSHSPLRLSQALRYPYQALLRHKMQRLVSGAAYGEVFTENMAREYGEIFGKSFYLINKGVDSEALTAGPIPDASPLRFLFAGSYDGERLAPLRSLAAAIDKEFGSGNAILDIYSPTPPDAVLESYRCVRLHNPVGSEEIRRQYAVSGWLVIAEGFSPLSVRETRLSFSTKIVDYLTASRPVLAIGPRGINTIDTLTANGMALVATSESEIGSALASIASGTVDCEKLTKAGRKYLGTVLDRRKIREGMVSRLKTMIK